MAKAKRIFEVAKELGVSSKAIVDKCQAEGVPGIQNHMSTVKLGLIQTIKEWFSQESEAHTAIETAEKVDLTKVRKARARAGHRKKEDHAETASAGAATAEQEPETSEADSSLEHPAVDAPARESAEDVPAHPHAIAPSIEPPAEASHAPEAAPAAGHATPAHPHGEAKARAVAPLDTRRAAPPAPIGRPNVPDRPTVVRPAGEKLDKPKEAVLKGPRVVRIERPDQVQAPRPKRGPAGSGGGGQTDESDDGEISRSRGPARGRGVGGKQAAGEAEGSAGKKAGGKRRSLTTRRGRSAEGLPTGPTKFSEQDLLELDARLRGAAGFLKQRRRDMKKKEGVPGAIAPAAGTGRIEIAEPIFIKDLSAATGIKAADIIKYLFKKGMMTTINSSIGAETAMEVALEYDIELVVKEQQTDEQTVLAEFESRKEIDVRPRPPVVTVLGHVDHGKTSLLDSIRQADVAAHEAGGITQHVGAYRVTVAGHEGGKGKTVVFLDTPGHEAFTHMRARGANMTDIVVLVVAADDGVMPQTVESINHARAAGVPIVVALNKIDKPEATEENIRRIYGQLAEQGLNPVEWGGETEIIRTSAVGGKGVKELLEMLDYRAELLELKADYGGTARGIVIEAQMQEGRGPVARVLVQQGQIKVGDFIVIGRAYGRVRDMADDKGKSLRDAGPATPLEVSGIDMLPDAGDKFYVTDSLQQAERIAMQYREVERTKQLASKTKVTLDNFADQLKLGQAKELRLVIKADVQGSVEVLRDSLIKAGTEEVAVRVLHVAVGGINESDVLLADASDAVIVGFGVVASSHARDLADERKVDIRLYRIIYELVEDVKKSIEGMLAPEFRETQHGEAEVRQIFRVGKVGTVAGCLVTTGIIRRSGRMRVIRDSVVVTENREIASLRRLKDDVRDVRSGLECGIHLVNFDDVKPGDRLVCYEVVQVKRTLGE
ncbi:MAG: translation initiation factor IF-2 [Phycisphaeraceae bacterium]|nr:translation initiation factor IF-2 [Phycisphaeraceae bacterium]